MGRGADVACGRRLDMPVGDVAVVTLAARSQLDDA
jgi:hypothetical protein